MRNPGNPAKPAARLTHPLRLESLPLRQELVGEEPYGAPQLDVPFPLNVNENPYPPSEKVCEAMGKALAKAAGQLNRYPDREALGLREDLAHYLGFGLTARNIWAGNGSNEVMTHILSAFGGPGRTLMAFTPTYSMYPEYARNTLTGYVTVPRDPYYRISADMVVDAVAQHQPDMVIIATPNNPTGTITPVSVIDEICDRFDGLVIVDEAYQEFTETPEDSSLALLPSHANLIVSRTLSKAFALAGGRVGYLAADPAIVDACRIVRLPYHLSTQTQVVARVALAHTQEMMAKVDQLRQDCQDLQEWCKRQGFEVVASQSNFFLFGRFVDRHQAWQLLLDQGVLVRETGPDGYLRICVGTPQANQAFKDGLLSLKGLPRLEPTLPRVSSTHRLH